MKGFFLFISFIFLFTSLGLKATVMPLQDRVLFSSTDSNKRLLVANSDSHAPVLLQSWIDDGTSGDIKREKNFPFVVIPAVAKMQPGKILNLKILPTEKIHELPRDRESVFWINLYEIPGVKKSLYKENTNKVEVGLNSQLKIIFRPFKGRQDIRKTARNLKFHLANDRHSLEIDNPTPYYVTPVSISIKSSSGEQPLDLGMGRMIAPFSHKKFTFHKAVEGENLTVQYTLVDDAGADESFSNLLN